MALKRLDEEFELKPGTQLLPYMKRLLPSLEGRFQNLESTQDLLAGVNEDIRAAALLRMNEILIPATKDILEVTQLGFLLAPVDGEYELVMGYMTLMIEEGVQRETFTPSPYLIIEHTPDDYAIARTMSYDQTLGILEITITALHGSPGPFSDWVVSSTPGMADSTKLYHDAVGPMHDTVVADYNEIVVMHAEILQAASDLEGAGLDLYNYVRKDGTSVFEGVQRGVHPVIGSNDTSFATTAWTRGRMNEYLMGSMSSSGASMTGPLYLFGAPTQPLMAATKGYVDSIIGAGGTVNNVLTITTTNASLRLRSTATGENRMVEALSIDGIRRWVLSLADSTPESGGNAGSNVSLMRYSDGGVFIDTAFNVNRATGATTVKSLNYNGTLTGVGDATITGQVLGNGNVWSITSPSTGTFHFGNTGTKYLQYNGTDFLLNGGALSTSIKAPSGWTSNWSTAFSSTPPGGWVFGGEFNAGAGAPNTGWWHQVNMRHSNASNMWGMQQAWGWEDNANEFYSRNWSGGVAGPWVRWLNSNNWSVYAQPRDPQLFAGFPINASGNGYWTTAQDSQKCMAFSGVVYINSGVHPVGTAITFIGYGGAMTIVCSGATMYWISPSGLTSGNRVLPDRGIATAVRTQDGNWVIGGTGLT
jgi:hypothetical protein